MMKHPPILSLAQKLMTDTKFIIVATLVRFENRLGVVRQSSSLKIRKKLTEQEPIFVRYILYIELQGTDLDFEEFKRHSKL
jgi:hypothetical protein